jgi:hypothetical protein
MVTLRFFYARTTDGATELDCVNGSNGINGRGHLYPGVFRFSDFANPVTIAIVGRTNAFKNARGMLTINGNFTFDRKRTASRPHWLNEDHQRCHRTGGHTAANRRSAKPTEPTVMR